MPNNPQLAWVFSDSVWVNCFVSVNNLSTSAIENEKIALSSPKKGAENAPGPCLRPAGAQKVGDVKVVSVWRAVGGPENLRKSTRFWTAGAALWESFFPAFPREEEQASIYR